MSDENAWDYSGIEKKTGFDAFSHRTLCPRAYPAIVARKGAATVRPAQGFALLRSASIPGKKWGYVKKTIGAAASFLLAATRGVSTPRTTRLVVTRERLLANDSRLMKSSPESRESSRTGSEPPGSSSHHRHSADESDHRFLANRERRWVQK